MSSSFIHICACPRCRTPEPHPGREINLLVSRLAEQQRRWFVALETRRVVSGGEALLARITGLDRRTIRQGQREFEVGLAERPSASVPQAVDAPNARRRIRSCFRFSKRCLAPRRQAIQWADVPKPGVARCIT